MKKQYVPAEVEILVLETADILLVSDPNDTPDFDKNNGGYNGSSWT